MNFSVYKHKWSKNKDTENVKIILCVLYIKANLHVMKIDKTLLSLDQSVEKVQETIFCDYEGDSKVSWQERHWYYCTNFHIPSH